MSNKVVVKVQNISKQYRLGQVGTGTLSHDLKRWWALARGKEDPYLKIGMVNDRTQKGGGEYAWALKDVSFELSQGDTLGIIGRNGAGKSTLLKLLSRVTSPTLGQIKAKGRIASLLEVGTGFHPELTGRENIYLNGTIMGMTKKEIASKFDEIVDFAGVELYIDTPVKRYSSGMYIRLAFGVAAHLEPEILIVDEVLAVGDAEFQKKCVGKMASVASDGRTVIFVSHNLQAIQSLCNKAIWLDKGHLKEQGETKDIISRYLNRIEAANASSEWRLTNELPSVYRVCITDVSILSAEDCPMGENINIQVGYHLKETVPSLQIGIRIFDMHGVLISTFYNSDYSFELSQNMGPNKVNIILDKPNLLPGTYTVTVNAVYNYGWEVYDIVEECVSFTLVSADVLGSGIPLYNDRGKVWFHVKYA